MLQAPGPLYDALTGLPNRVLLARKLQEVHGPGPPAPATQLGVAYLDLDGFKPVNDRLGHGAGDRLLVAVGRHGCRARCSWRTTAWPAWGATSSCSCCPGWSRVADLRSPFARPRDGKRGSAPYPLDTERVVVTASIGYTLFPSGRRRRRHPAAPCLTRPCTPPSRPGRNRFHQFDAAQDRAVQLLARPGPAACATRWTQAQFTLYLQPKVDMRMRHRGGRPKRCSRWRHPERGLLASRRVLAAASRAPTWRSAFGQWVIEAALHRC